MSTLNNTQTSEATWATRWHIGQRVWQWCSTKTALLLFLLPVAMALIASYLLPQAPSHIYTDSFRYQEWLSERQVEFKNWTPLLTTIGAFHIRETLWFPVLLALLGFVLLVSLGEQIRLLFLVETEPKPPTFYDSTDAVSLTSNLSREQTIPLVQRLLRQHTVHREEQGTTYLYGGRHTWARAGAAVIYLGLLLLVGGLAIQARSGWRQQEIRVLPYENVGLGPNGALQVRLIDVQPVAQDDAEPSAPTATLQIAGETILPIQLGVPARHRGYRYLWVSKGGPSVQLSAYRVSDPTRSLTLYDYAIRPSQSDSLQFSFASGQDPDRQFILSEDQVVGWLRWQDTETPEDVNGPRFQLWLFGEDGQELGVETFQPKGDAATLHAVIGDVDYRLEVARYIVLDIAHQPGQWLLWLGGALLALGALGLLVPRKRIWTRIAAENDRLLVQVREQTKGVLRLRGNKRSNITARLRDALGSDSFENAFAQEQAPGPPEQELNTHRNNQ
jgi:hypothetical protein